MAPRKPAAKPDPVLPAGHRFLAFGAMCWGTGKTSKAALADCRRNRVNYVRQTEMHLYIVPEGSWIDGMGMLRFPESHPHGSCTECRADQPLRIVAR